MYPRLHKANSIRPSFYSSLGKHDAVPQYFGASVSGVQLGRAGIVVRRLVRVKRTIRYGSQTTSQH